MELDQLVEKFYLFFVVGICIGYPLAVFDFFNFNELPDRCLFLISSFWIHQSEHHFFDFLQVKIILFLIRKILSFEIENSEDFAFYVDFIVNLIFKGIFLNVVSFQEHNLALGIVAFTGGLDSTRHCALVDYV